MVASVTASTACAPKPSASEIFALRSKCAEIGKEFADTYGPSPVLTPHVEIHYNVGRNRCYVMIRTVYAMDLYDAQTGEKLVELWHRSEDQNFVKDVPGKRSNAVVQQLIDQAMEFGSEL